MCLQYKSSENTEGKGEIARNKLFLLFPQCFQPVWRTFFHFHQIQNCRLETLSVWKSLKSVVWERVYSSQDYKWLYFFSVSCNIWRILLTKGCKKRNQSFYALKWVNDVCNVTAHFVINLKKDYYILQVYYKTLCITFYYISCNHNAFWNTYYILQVYYRMCCNTAQLNFVAFTDRDSCPILDLHCIFSKYSEQFCNNTLIIFLFQFVISNIIINCPKN